MDKNDLKEIETMFKQHVGVLYENFQHKLDIVVEGHQLLNSKIDRLQESHQELAVKVDRIEIRTLNIEQGQQRLEKRQERLEQEMKRTKQELVEKIDVVTVDLSAHRADTEIHHSRYGISEKKS